MAKKTSETKVSEQFTAHLEREADRIVSRKLGDLEGTLAKLLASALTSSLSGSSSGASIFNTSGASAGGADDLFSARHLNLILRQLPKILRGESEKKITTSSIETERSSASRARFSESRAQMESGLLSASLRGERYQ